MGGWLYVSDCHSALYSFHRNGCIYQLWDRGSWRLSALYHQYDAIGPGRITGELEYIAPVFRYSEESADPAAMTTSGALRLTTGFGIFASGSNEPTRFLGYSHPGEQFEFSGWLYPDSHDQYIIPYAFEQVPLAKYTAAWFTSESKGEGSPIVVTIISPQAVELTISVPEIDKIQSTNRLIGDQEHGADIKGALYINGNGCIGSYWAELFSESDPNGPISPLDQHPYWKFNIDSNTNGRIFFEIRNLAAGNYRVSDWKTIATQSGFGYWQHDQTSIYNDQIPYWYLAVSNDQDVEQKVYCCMVSTAPLDQPELAIWLENDCGKVDVELSLSHQLDWKNDYQLLLESDAPVGQFNDRARSFLCPEHLIQVMSDIIGLD